MAFQMGLIIAAGTYGGTLLDDLVNIKFPVFTIILSLAAVAGAIWLMIKELSNTNNK
ncbi:MAG: AtpZ/AtpI family protein [Lentimicrobium sp.]|nr:AtpZ/AtpI family protein [Lentimicrobium sp.]